MTAKIIVSKSALEAAFKTVSQCKTADYCEGFNDAIKEILNNAQVVNSEPVGYIDKFGNFENSLKQWMVEEPNVTWSPLFTTPQPAPDTVPRAEYDKLLDALREAKDDIADWGSYAPEFFQIKHDLAGDMAKYNTIIAESEVNCKGGVVIAIT